MMIRRALCSALMMAVAASAAAAEKKPPAKSAKPAPKTASKPPAKPVAKAPAKPATKTSAKKPAKAAVAKAAPKKAAQPVTKASFKPSAAPWAAQLPAPAQAMPLVLKGPKEVLTCRNGTEDRHARIAVVLVGGKTESFAYYSKWKPRTCSIFLQRNRDSSKWMEKGTVTNVSTDRGLFLIEHGKGEYRIVFRDVDRERYCGMDGVMNGTLTIRKGSEQCEVAGIMEEGVPLGQAVAYMEQQNAAAAAQAAEAAPAAAAAPAAPAPAAPKQVASRRWWQGSTSTFPSATVGLSD